MTTSKGQASRVLLGEITGVHGIRGDVVIRSYTSDAADIASYGRLSDAAGTTLFEISVVRDTGKGVVAKISGVEDRSSAERLRGTKLYIERDRLPETSEAEFYHADLIGLRAMTPEGAELGTVVAIQNYGAGDLLEIRLAGSKATELIPFADAFVPAIDLASGIVTIIMPSFVADENDKSEEPGN